MGQNNITMTFQTIAADIRTIYKSDPPVSAALIETYLERHLKQNSPKEKLSVIRDLARWFEVVSPAQNLPSAKYESGEFSDHEEYSHLFTLLFGKNMAKFDLSSEENLEKLAQSLNTIFDTLNQTIGVIHATLLGEQSELETIRHIIGSEVESDESTDSLQTYLSQIQRAFLIAHRAYQEAAKTKMRQILEEISPDKISESAGGSLKFGPFKKAELFEIYAEKHALCKRWLESGRLMEEVLRDFERICQKLYYSMDMPK